MKPRSACTLAVCLLAMALSAQAEPDTFRIYFRSGATRLDEVHERSLDSFIYRSNFGKDTRLGIVGYADEPGTAALNSSIGQKRARSVRDYLLSSGFSNHHMEACIGMGNRNRTGVDAHERRVDIVAGWKRVSSPGDSSTAAAASGLYRLHTMKPNETLVLEQLQFSVSTSSFLPESYAVLKELVAVLKAHPTIRIGIEGHICCGPAPNSKDDTWFSLSVERAKAVYTHLIANGISADRLSYQGLGFSKPRVFPEKTERDRFRNRRVELRIRAN